MSLNSSQYLNYIYHFVSAQNQKDSRTKSLYWESYYRVTIVVHWTMYDSVVHSYPELREKAISHPPVFTV